MYQYSSLGLRLSIKIAKFSRCFGLSISKRDLDTKKATPNIEVWPESLGATLEYWYIERGLLKTALLRYAIGLKNSRQFFSSNQK